MKVVELFPSLAFFEIGVFEILPCLLLTCLNPGQVFVQPEMSNQKFVKFLLQLAFFGSANNGACSAAFSAYHNSAVVLQDGSVVQEESGLAVQTRKLLGLLEINSGVSGLKNSSGQPSSGSADPNTVQDI